MNEIFSRTELLFGKDALAVLASSHVAVFGIGGVGGHAAEALIRSGVGALTIVDHDTVAESNLNRQIFATVSELGNYKVDAAARRLCDINPSAVINARRTFYTDETAAEFDFSEYDYVVDAIDTVSGKLALAVRANEAGTPIISSMGAGNKLDPTRFEVADIYETSVCPLARVMRHELRKRGIDHLKVVYSKEEPIAPRGEAATDVNSRKRAPGSCAFVPSVAGLIIAGEVICDLVGIKR